MALPLLDTLARSSARWSARLAWFGALFVLALALAPSIAEAHAAIVSSEPPPGQRLASAPGVVVVRFTEPINTRLSRATVTGPTAQRFDGVASGAQEVQVPLPTNAAGVYEVAWTTVSLVDGHTLSGRFQFGVGVTPEEAEGTVRLAPEPIDLLIAVARSLEYAGLLMAIGMLLVQRLAQRNPPLAWVRCRLQWPLAVAFVSGILVVLGEAVAAAPAPSTGAIADYLGAGLPGLARVGRLAAEALALQLSMLGSWYAAPPLLLAVLALAAAGHAAAIRPVWWGIGADAIHLLAAGLWAGGILAMTTLRPPDGWRGVEARPLLERFSPVALVAFVATASFGAIRGIQELSNPLDLLMSSYGEVLSVKVLLVLAMVPLSVLAWRRRLVRPRIEAAVAVAVIGAAALLAAHPLPPGRAREAEDVREPTSQGAALPEAGDLTLGGDAGQVLVGLTLRPGTPGQNDVLVYLLPIDGVAAARGIPATLSASGATVEMTQCGSTCRRGELDLAGGERLEVHIGGDRAGTAVFDLPPLPAPDGADLVERMASRMHGLETYRVEEVLGPADPPVRTRYGFQAPDRMEYQIDNGSQLTWVGGTRYLKDSPTASSQVEQTGFGLTVPSFIWDLGPTAQFVAPRLLGTGSVDGVDTQVVSFFMISRSAPVWFRLWIDADGLVHRAVMRAQGHFMDHRYYDLDAPFTIQLPVGG